MKLRSAERLRAFVGPEPDKAMSQRRLATVVGCSPGFVNHLTAGRRTSCSDAVATRIAGALGVPIDLLFEIPSTTDPTD